MSPTSRFPMPRYPNGWFQVAASDELPPAGPFALIEGGHNPQGAKDSG